MRVFTEGKVVYIDVKDSEPKEPGGKSWRRITYQVYCSQKGFKHELQEFEDFGEAEKTEVNPGMLAAERNGAEVRVTFLATIDHREGRRPEQKCKVLRVDLLELPKGRGEGAPAAPGNGSAAKPETVGAK